MPWLLLWIARDRPGLLNDITSVIRLRNLNIRNIVGSQRSILLEVEGEVREDLINELGGIDGVGAVNTIEQSFGLLGFVRETFMRAVLYYVMERDPGLLEVLGYEYGKELMRHLMTSLRDFRDALYVSLRALTALGILTFIGIQFMPPNKTVITIEGAFDEDVGMPMTRGIVRGLMDSMGGARHSVSVVRRGSNYEFVVT